MGDLKCKHCGVEKSYADANIADVRGDTCLENTRTEASYVEGRRMTATLELEHEWYEPDAVPDVEDIPEDSRFELNQRSGRTF